jgi:CubicO group peptidase (beta-lactamase class C family)
MISCLIGGPVELNVSGLKGGWMKLLRRSGIVLLGTCALFFVGLASAQTTPDTVVPDLAVRLSAIEKAVETKRNELHVAGAALAIVKDDRIIYSKGFGLRDIDARLPVTPQTLFAIGSCTKAFTAMAALISQEQGKLSLTDPPRKYLPYFKLQDPDLDARVTLADLLSHRTGLMAYTDIPWITGVLRSDQVIQAMANAKPTAKLGEKFQYNNVMFLAAGECVATAQGTSYANVIHRLIFAPLGMHASDLSIREMQRTPDHASGYDAPERDKPLRRLPMRDLSNIAPAGAINSNVTDMARWIRLMLGGGAIDGKRLITEQSYKELVSPHMAAGANSSYGYGWVLDTWHGHRQIWHNGGIDGFNAHLAMLPDEHLGFILLTNISESELPTATVDAVFTNLVGSTEPNSAPSMPTKATPFDPDPAHETGEYQLGDAKKGSTLDIKVLYRDSQLFVHPHGQPEFAMTLVGDHRYMLAPPAPSNIFITFRTAKSDPGRTELVLEQQGVTIIGLPVAVASFSAPISVEELMQKIVQAKGGEAALRTHHTLQVVLSMNMENEGVTGEIRQYWRLPNMAAEVDRFNASGRMIGLAHDYFDGTGGRNESTFAPPDIHTGKGLTDARLQAVFAPELAWKSLYKTVVIERMDKVEGEEVYVVRKTPDNGNDVVDYISTHSFQLLKREAPGGVTEIYRDYRKVGDVLLPYEIDRADANGRTTLKVKRAILDSRLSAALFQSGYQHCRP